MEFRFDAMLFSNLCNENSDAGHVNCSRGLQVPTHGLSRHLFLPLQGSLFVKFVICSLAFDVQAGSTCGNSNKLRIFI